MEQLVMFLLNVVVTCGSPEGGQVCHLVLHELVLNPGAFGIDLDASLCRFLIMRRFRFIFCLLYLFQGWEVLRERVLIGANVFKYLHLSTVCGLIDLRLRSFLHRSAPASRHLGRVRKLLLQTLSKCEHGCFFCLCLCRLLLLRNPPSNYLFLFSLC